jgi:hypothetical protein
MKITITKNNRTFEVYVNSIGCHIVEVNFYEVVRPSWKIFRTKFFPFYSTYFFVDEFNTILEGVHDCLNTAFIVRQIDDDIANKWKEFEKIAKERK